MERITHILATLAIAAMCTRSEATYAEDAEITHGRHLVQLGGRTDCRTPGHLLGNPDMARYLGGSDVGLEVAGWGPSSLRTSLPTGRPGSAPGRRKR
jgi:hypothetical protein